MLFNDLTEGSYNFLGGSIVDVCSESYLSIRSILPLKGEKWAYVRFLAFVIERSNLFT